MKLLSIIIPHYNTPNLLGILLNSIPDISQIEVLVVDDNSDKDRDVYEECKEKNEQRNVAFYENTVDKKGAGNARNVGLEHAQGKWLLFADADDFFVEGFWDILSEYMDEDADVIYFSPTSVMLNGNGTSDRHVYYKNLVENYCKEENHVNELKLRYQYWSPCSKVIRREMVEKNYLRFDGTLHSNDVMFSARTGHFAKRIKAVDSILYCITQSKASLTAKTDEKSLAIRKKVFSNYYFFLHSVLPAKDMHILGFGLKDYLYFWAFRLGLVK